MEHCLKMGQHSTSQMQLNMTYASKLKVSFSKKKVTYNVSLFYVLTSCLSRYFILFYIKKHVYNSDTAENYNNYNTVLHIKKTLS